MLTVLEVCDALGISKYTCYRLIHDGKMPAVQVSGGRHRYMVKPEVLEKFTSTEDFYDVEPAYIVNGPKLMTASEVASVLRCATETVRRLAASGELKAVRNPGRNSHWRIDRRAVTAYLKRRAQLPGE
jgi:excisionase family DNA binding protein